MFPYFFMYPQKSLSSGTIKSNSLTRHSSPLKCSTRHFQKRLLSIVSLPNEMHRLDVPSSPMSKYMFRFLMRSSDFFVLNTNKKIRVQNSKILKIFFFYLNISIKASRAVFWNRCKSSSLASTFKLDKNAT